MRVCNFLCEKAAAATRPLPIERALKADLMSLLAVYHQNIVQPVSGAICGW